MIDIDFDTAIEFLKAKGCRILPKEGKFKIDLNKDKNGYNLIIVPDNPKYSIVIMGLNRNGATSLRDKLNMLLMKKI